MGRTWCRDGSKLTWRLSQWFPGHHLGCQTRQRAQHICPRRRQNSTAQGSYRNEWEYWRGKRRTSQELRGPRLDSWTWERHVSGDFKYISVNSVEKVLTFVRTSSGRVSAILGIVSAEMNRWAGMPKSLRTGKYRPLYQPSWDRPPRPQPTSRYDRTRNTSYEKSAEY